MLPDITISVFAKLEILHNVKNYKPDCIKSKERLFQDKTLIKIYTVSPLIFNTPPPYFCSIRSSLKCDHASKNSKLSKRNHFFSIIHFLKKSFQNRIFDVLGERFCLIHFDFPIQYQFFKTFTRKLNRQFKRDPVKECQSDSLAFCYV